MSMMDDLLNTLQTDTSIQMTLTVKTPFTAFELSGKLTREQTAALFYFVKSSAVDEE